MLREYRNYLKWKKDKARMAAGESKYLLNLFGDVSLLEEVINKVSTEGITAEFITLDGTRVIIRKQQEEKRRRVEWERG